MIDSIGGIFSLSELGQSGSLKYLGLYSCSVGLGHGPESEVTPNITFLRSQNSWKFLGKLFPSFGWLLPWVETFLSTSQYPLPAYGSLSLFLLLVSEVQHLLVSHMRKTHSQSCIRSLVILPLLSKIKKV